MNLVCGLTISKLASLNPCSQASKLILKRALSYCYRHHLSAHSELHLGSFHVQWLCYCCQNTFSSRYVHPVIHSHPLHENDILVPIFPACISESGDASHPALHPSMPLLSCTLPLPSPPLTYHCLVCVRLTMPLMTYFTIDRS